MAMWLTHWLCELTPWQCKRYPARIGLAEKYRKQLHIKALAKTVTKIQGRAASWVRHPENGNSALMLAAARLRHIVGTRWDTRRYMNMNRLREMQNEVLAEVG